MDIQNLLPQLFVAFCAIIAGVMFLNGYYHDNPNSRWRKGIDPDKIFFPKLDNKRLITAADQLAFLICVGTAVLIAVLGILTSTGLLYVNAKEPVSLSVVLLFLAAVASWVMRYVFIILYKDKPGIQIPRIWPFRANSR